MGRTARRGDVVTVQGVRLEVEAVRRFAVARIRLVPDASAEDAPAS